MDYALKFYIHRSN